MAILAAIGGSLTVAAIKFIAAMATGSAAILAEMIHSLVETADGLLLFLGLERSLRPADSEHPFGHGKELYFWSLAVAMLVFVVGALVTVYQGVLRILDPVPVRNLAWAYGALGIAILFESTSLAVAYRQLRETIRKQSLWKTIRSGNDSSLQTVFLQGSTALTGLLLAFLGVTASTLFQAPALDGMASVAIGLLLGGIAFLLGRGCLSLLVGEGTDPAVAYRIRSIAEQQPGVIGVQDPLTVYFGPESMLVNLVVEFPPTASAEEVTLAIDEIEYNIKQEFPEVKQSFIAAEAYKDY